MPQPTGLYAFIESKQLLRRGHVIRVYIFSVLGKLGFQPLHANLLAGHYSGRMAPTTQNAHQLMKIPDGEETLAVFSCAEFSSQA
jgi:hypothetical protein